MFSGFEPAADAGAASDYVVSFSGLSGPQMPLRWRINSLYASFALYRLGIERQTLIKGWSMPSIRCPRRVVEHRGGQGDYLVDLQSDLLWDLNTPEVAP